MRILITAAALSLAIAAPAFAQETKPAVTPSLTVTKPVDAPKTTTTTPAVKPVDPATAKTGEIKKEETKVDPKVVAPSNTTTKVEGAKGGVAATVEKPAETKKQ